MVLKSFCQHCDSEVAPEQSACSRCGAPSSSTIFRAPQLDPGYLLYQNAWRGFATVYPQGWDAAPSEGSGVVFATPDGGARLELALLPAQSMMTAAQHAELYLASLPGHQGEILEGSSDTYLRATFQGPICNGFLSVHLSPQGGTLGVARGAHGYTGPLEEPFAKMLANLSAIPPIERRRWVEPQEGAFALDLPTGWQCQSRLAPPPTMTGVRQPMARVFAESSGHILIALEPEYQVFVHGELPRQAAPEEGLFGMLGRMVSNAGHSMASAMGEVVCPFHGLRPVVEHVFWPRWQQSMPGSRLLSFNDHGRPDAAEVRILLPGDVLRVLRLSGHALGNTGRWMAGYNVWYQAPLSLMPKFEPIFVGLATSVESNPAWRQNELSRSTAMFSNQMNQQQQFSNQWANLNNALHRQRLNDISMAGQANTAIHQNRLDIGDMQMAGWHSQSTSFAHMQHQGVNAIRETSDFVNPSTGAVHNLSHHVQNYWEVGRDVVVGSNAQLQTPPDWTPLRPWDGR